MKKYLSLILPMCAWLLAACLFLPQYAYADPPQDVVLSYNIQSQTLTVTVTHPSSFTGFHYIKQVKITKNNELAEKNDYRSQASKTTFVYTYKVPAAVNDILEVTATCNIHGKKTAMLKVAQEKN
jgi:desulfoferrodoxin (superoxide reductase-like protein)